MNKRRSFIRLFYISLLIAFIYLSVRFFTQANSTAIIVLGGGLTSTGELPIHTQLRVNKAVEIYQSLTKSNNCKIITLSGGTTHKPNPLDSKGFPILEAAAAAKQLILMGIKPDDVLEENYSLDTLGNAYFLRTLHIDPGSIRRLIIITNNWHMDRTQAMFNHVFGLPSRRGQFGNMFGPWSRYSLQFESVESGLTNDILRIRSQREKDSLQQFNYNTKHQFDDMIMFHDWIFTQHSAYASFRSMSGQGEAAGAMSAELLKTY